MFFLLPTQQYLTRMRSGVIIFIFLAITSTPTQELDRCRLSLRASVFDLTSSISTLGWFTVLLLLITPDKKLLGIIMYFSPPRLRGAVDEKKKHSYLLYYTPLVILLLGLDKIIVTLCYLQFPHK